MPSDSVILPEVVKRVGAILGDDLARPIPADEPSELEFIEIMTSFHTVYRDTLAEYVGVMTTLYTVLLDTDYHLEAGKRVFDFDETMGRFILDLLLIDDDEYPLRNLLYRIAESIGVIMSKPTAVYQSKFITHLPTKVVKRAIHFMDDKSGFRFTRTCREYRAMDDPRMYRSAYFRMRYRNYVIQGVTEIDTNTLYMDVLNAMVNARANTVSSAIDYMTNSGTASYVRSLSFDNEWPRMWPRQVSKSALLQEGSSAEIFDPLYGVICTAIRDLELAHLRLVSLALHPRITHQIANCTTLTRLTVERTIATCQIADFAYQMLRKLRNIAHLTLGFGPDSYTHERVWTTFALCQCVQHVYAFADPITHVGLEYPFYCKALDHVHSVDTLHIHGSTARLDNLLYWLGAASAERRVPGALRRVKVHTYATFSGDDAYWLVSVLGRYHPNLRILVLDGLESVHPRLFAHIRASLKELEALCVVRRISPNMHAAKLVGWSHASYQYAEALHGHPTLRHIEVNMLWDFNEPFALADPDDDTPSLSSASSTSSAPPIAEGADNFDRAYDGISIAKTFAAHMPSLESFAVRNDVTFFSCAVYHESEVGFRLDNIQAEYLRMQFENWNPRSGKTWDDV